MKNFVGWLSVLGLVTAFSLSSLCAQDEKKDKKAKGDASKQMVTQFMKNLEPAGLSADLKSKIEEMYGKVAKEVSMKRTEAGITAEMLKKQQDVRKEGKDAGKKGKEIAKEVAEKVKLTDDQSKIMEDTDAALAKVKIEVGKLLSEEQMAKIEDNQFKNSLKEKGANKKKKAA